mmetsp:Transcript_805/g.2090  ORF Transcript_805/g.2090 Transcript_805/m.2090 type:complete len:195 (+) Transcript_805:850-1434(+)
MMHWRLHVVTTPGLTLQANFLTRETFLDIVTSCIMPRHPALDRQAHPDPRRASVAKVKGFFQRPCKHYPLTDTYVSGADAEGKELAEQISDLLRNFNQSIQEESKDRKYRFVVKRLMKAHQRAGETLDTELDFYRDDDDVAVLYYDAQGRRVWALGNIEEVAVARGAVDEQRAVGGTGAAFGVAWPVSLLRVYE